MDTKLTKPQQELFNAATAAKRNSIFVQGPTFRTAQALVKKGIGTFAPLTANRGWYIAKSAQPVATFTIQDEQKAMDTHEKFREQNIKGEWTARNNGTGKRSWFAYNERTGEYYKDAKGNLVRYTFIGAVFRAESLNAEQEKAAAAEPTPSRFTVTGQYRDNGRMFINSSIDLSLHEKRWGSVEADPTFGIFATRDSAWRVMDRLFRAQSKTGFNDWTDLRIEVAQ